MTQLTDFVEATATKFGIPGVAVGVWADGQATFACHGVTSLDNPLPITKDTLYLLGSITKTYTATALMRLVADGRVELNAPVHRYVPELALADQQAATEITVLNLLNHTAGLDARMIIDTGAGDDALARYVAEMAALEQIAPVGARASYSQVGFNLAGRIIEKVTGLTYEKAVATLVLEPLGLSDSHYLPDDIMTRRFAVGHNPGEDGSLAVARPWKDTRADHPGGGLASTVADQLRWARFHLGDGRTESGAELLPTDALTRMQEQTIALRGSTLGDAIGIGWFLREVDGVRTVGHGGSSNGQFADLLLIPERNFAVIVMANAGPEGIPCNKAVLRWVLETYVGVTDRDPEPLPYDETRAQEIFGTYEYSTMALTIDTDGTAVTLEVVIKPEVRAASEIELPPDYSPFELGLLPGDDYILTSGALAGQRGFFTRDEHGHITGADLAGRLFNRVGP
ncbi:serine hydrolase domain-containing protein [Nocardia sp. NPDC050175]|uniref:serine hydrolase domain-containing protein n=1 Tax=Nocardia sp. NPDC050175 TaxID=3364317 RepID=UPI0037906803